jgi:hypothetical protein
MSEQNFKLILLSKEEQELIINYRNELKIQNLLKVHSGFEYYTINQFSNLDIEDIKILLSIHNKNSCAALCGGHCKFCESGMYNELLNRVNYNLK